MAETLRTYSQMLALLADNDTGEIGAQDLKDALFSFTQAWGALTRQGASDQDLNGTEIINFTIGAAGQLEVDTGAANSITIPVNGDGSYRIDFGASVNLLKVTVSPSIQLKVYKNGSEITGSLPQPQATADQSVGQDTEFMSCLAGSGIVDLVAGDVITLYAVASSGGSSTVTLKDAHLVLQRLK